MTTCNAGTMHEPKNLKPYMQTCFTAAKQKLVHAESLALALSVVAVLAVLVPEDYGLIGWAAGVLSVLLLVAQQHESYRFRSLYCRAEDIRRLYLLCDGLGCHISQSNLAPLERRYGELEVDDEAYYTSHLEPGPKRLWMLVWESAFWSEDLQERMAKAFWWKAIGTSGLVFVALLFALYGPEGPVVSRVIPPALALFVGLNFWGRWWESREVQRVCEATTADCRARVEGGASARSEADELRDVMQVVLNYSATMLMAYPPSDKLYQSRRDHLNKAWNRVVESLAGSEWGRQEGKEL